MAARAQRKAPSRKEASTPPQGREEATFSIEESLSLQMRETHKLFARALERRISRYGVTTGMWFYLRLLWERGVATPGELSDYLGIRGPTALQVLKEMEAKKLIWRETDPSDRRRTLVRLTPSGEKLKKTLLAFAIEVQDLALADVTAEDERVFRHVLRQIRAALERNEMRSVGKREKRRGAAARGGEPRGAKA